MFVYMNVIFVRRICQSFSEYFRPFQRQQELQTASISVQTLAFSLERFRLEWTLPAVGKHNHIALCCIGVSVTQSLQTHLLETILSPVINFLPIILWFTSADVSAWISRAL